MNTILYIDGRNFLGKLETVLKHENKPIPEWYKFDFKSLLQEVLKDIDINEKIFYFARIKQHADTIKKSQQLIQSRRLLKTHLEQQAFKMILAGVVRGNYTKDSSGQKVLIFKEKGVDVKIAVDMTAAACDKTIQRAILASSDSDLQPAIKKLNERGVETIYLGFELLPNKGLIATTTRTILIRNSEVINYIK